MPSIHELRHTLHEVGKETLRAAPLLRDEFRRTRRAYRELAHEIQDDLTVTQLVEIGHSPISIYHNSGNLEYARAERRLRSAFQDPLITGVEFDVVYYLGDLHAAHGHGPLTTNVLRYQKAREATKLERLVDIACRTESRFNFDLRISNPLIIDKFMEVLDTVPEDKDIIISGMNWETIQYVLENYKTRPIKALFSVNGRNRMRGEFRDMVEQLQIPDMHQIGVSVHKDIASESFLSYLKSKDFYSLVYTVDSRLDLIRFAQLGVDGVTSNNPHILHITERARQELTA